MLRLLGHQKKVFKFCTMLSPLNPLVNIIKEEIKKSGPISMPTFWNKALLHEKHGYYMKKDVFNKKGDFITSVEISQMFCELIGIWIIYALQQMQIIDPLTMTANGKINLLEFGPGLGTLQCQIIRVLHQFNLLKDVQITFIEYSDFMRQKQQENVVKQLQKCGIFVKYEYQDVNKSLVERFTSEQVNLRWFKTYEYMIFEDYGENILKPNSIYMNKILKEAPIILLAHEFFDALPVHIFQFDKQLGWCEKLIGLETSNQGKNFQFELSKGSNPNVEKILRPNERFSKEVIDSLKDGDSIEVGAQGSVLLNSVSELISKVGGCGLVIDYGENHSFSDSIRAIAKHKILPVDDILDKPGECDLSAYVDFAALGQAVKEIQDIKVSQIMTQGLWLESMGINARLEALCQISNMATEKMLKSEVDRLVNKDQMGDIFKFMCIQHQKYGDLFPFLEETQKIYY